ncbi:MAG: outer membrane lipoprotein chaperone LolA [Colwellia sp.]|nr:outer membrane lipoprotein chaperone LolA [Colwellia sp.]MCW8866239.1 outer membrane lipoprotein chaperone LolA [Colwellia sp.]MCW9081609.1 outer membrane lipoprotein chaperone LolA [Colwellia sp.]
MKIHFKKLMTLAMAMSLSANTFAQSNELSTIAATDDQQVSQAQVSASKSILMSKLSKLDFFTANFSQQVLSEAGEVIEESSGELAISKPNLANWQVLAPDELSIVSDGSNVWFYNPWIEQVSVYALSAAIARTPILLLTSKDETLWQQYTVSQKVKRNKDDKEIFVIQAIDTNSQIKSLTLAFNTTAQGGQLSEFSFLDATGQLSHITLTAFNDQQAPSKEIFNFVVPPDTQVDDQR